MSLSERTESTEDEEEILEVTNKNAFLSKANRIFSEDGLFSESIFGPNKNYSCKCGRLSNKILDSGKRCSKCNVLCVSNEERFKIYGYISLPFNVIKPTKIKELKKVIPNINKYKNTLLDHTRSDLNITQTRYLGIDRSDLSIKIYDDNKDINIVYLPLKIKGIYTLTLGLRYIAEVFGFPHVQELFDEQIIMSKIYVIPAGIRPISYDTKDSTKIQYTDVNKFYTSILNLNHANRMLIDTKGVEEDEIFEYMTQYLSNPDSDSENKIIDHMIETSETVTARYSFYVNALYDILYKSIAGKEGMIRNDSLGKTLDFSARTVVCCDPSLMPYEIGVGKKILYNLWILYFMNYEMNVNNKSGLWCINNIVMQNYDYNKSRFDKFLDWFLK